MNKKIEKVFIKLNNKLSNEMPFNTPAFRKEFTKRLRKEIGGDVLIRCDEYNNSPEIVALCGLVAHVWFLSDEQFNPVSHRLVFSQGAESSRLVAQIEKEDYEAQG